MRLCFFKRLAKDECRYRADGEPDPCHLIPQQRVKHDLRALGWTTRQIKDALWDRRLIVPGCRHHHDAFDGKRLVLLSDDYPPALHEWAEDFGFTFIDPRTGWVATRDNDYGGEAA